jgi:glycosyltransferase involved in cell wall biosynthesis
MARKMTAPRQEGTMVSVIMPVYNAEATIGAAVASVLGQTHRDFELIVVDARSSDGTLGVLASIRDDRLEVLSIPSCCWPATSRNRGLERSTGEFVAFIDADDIWLPDKLSVQLSALRNTPDAAVAYCWADYVDPTGRYVCPDSRPDFEGNVYAAMLADNFIDSGSNIMVRRDCLLAVGSFDESLPVVEDWDLYVRLAARRPFVCLPSVLVQYRQSSTSLTNRLALMEESFWRVVNRAFAAAPESLRYLKRQRVAKFYQYLTGKATYDCPSRRSGLSALRFFAEAVRHHPSSLFLVWRKSWVVKALLKALLCVVLPAPAMQWGVRHWPAFRRSTAASCQPTADGSETVA